MDRFPAILLGAVLGAGGTISATAYAGLSKADVYLPMDMDSVEGFCAERHFVQTDAGKVRAWTVNASACADPDPAVSGFERVCSRQRFVVDPDAANDFVATHVLPGYATAGKFSVAK